MNRSCHRAGKRARHRTGIATLEFALVLPILLVLVFGMVDYGWKLHIMHTMNVAARDGARQLAVRGATTEQARDVALDRLDVINAPFTVEAIGPLANGDVTVRVSVPADQVTLGFLDPGEGALLETSITMRREGG
jgi:Flp pilus assembly protein TadG